MAIDLKVKVTWILNKKQYNEKKKKSEFKTVSFRNVSKVC